MGSEARTQPRLLGHRPGRRGGRSRSSAPPRGSATSRSGRPSPTAPTWSASSPGWRRRPRRSTSARRSCRCRRARPPPRRWPGRRSTSSPAAASSSASAPPARRSPRAGTACPTRSPGAAPASTSKWCARSSPARARSSTRASTTTLPLPGGEGKALKLNFHPLRNEIPVFVGAIGRKSVEMAAEICDGWIPIFFSVDAFEATWGEHLEAGFAKGGRQRSDLEVSPLAAGGDRRRPRGGQERRQGRPRPLLRRHGQPQDQLLRRPRPPLRLRRGRRRGPERFQDGERAGAFEAMPDEIVEATSLVGTEAEVAERVERFRGAGIDRLIVSPVHVERCRAAAHPGAPGRSGGALPERRVGTPT